MKISPRRNVPQYKLRPNPIALSLLIFILVIGTLVSILLFEHEDSHNIDSHKGIISALITFIISICLLIATMSKYRFIHLWKKNSLNKRYYNRGLKKHINKIKRK